MYAALLFAGMVLCPLTVSQSTPNETYSSCLTCFDVASPSDCGMSQMCGREEICFTREFTDHEGRKRFRLGCNERAICNVFANGPLMLGKRGTKGIRCMECCEADKCNDQLCQRGRAPSTSNPSKPSLPTDAKSFLDVCIPFKGSCYLMVNQTKSWENARSDCKRLGADLVSINTGEEQTFLDAHFKQTSYEYTWTGGKRVPPAVYWFKWVDGTDSRSYINWDVYEPNEYPNFNYTGIYQNSGKWNFLPNVPNGRNYICEKMNI